MRATAQQKSEHVHQKTCTGKLIAASIIIINIYNNSLCQSTTETINNSEYIQTIEHSIVVSKNELHLYTIM